jgi:hypothetical protein
MVDTSFCACGGLSENLPRQASQCHHILKITDLLGACLVKIFKVTRLLFSNYVNTPD